MYTSIENTVFVLYQIIIYSLIIESYKYWNHIWNKCTLYFIALYLIILLLIFIGWSRDYRLIIFTTLSFSSNLRSKPNQDKKIKIKKSFQVKLAVVGIVLFLCCGFIIVIASYRAREAHAAHHYTARSYELLKTFIVASAKNTSVSISKIVIDNMSWYCELLDVLWVAIFGLLSPYDKLIDAYCTYIT